MSGTLAFLLDENNDPLVDPATGDFILVDEAEGIAQISKNAAQTRLGEMIFEGNQGLPDFQNVWNGNPNILEFEGALRDTLVSIPGVIGVDSIYTQIEDNVLYYTANIITQFGSTAFTGEFNV